MGFFDFFKSIDINSGLEQYRNTDGAVLVDVRTEEEYAEGHIPSSINIPLSNLNSISYKIEDKDTPLFVHCLSGGRSALAVSTLKRNGYSDVMVIGGINGYYGKIER